jgi:hypothetical protein
MLQTSQTLSHLTKIDSLQTQINHLNHVVDSLNTISSATSIGTGYFHDIIGGTFTSFVGFIAIIATIAGYISWKIIADRFDRMATQIRHDFQNRMTISESNFEKLTANFEGTVARITKDTNRLHVNSKRAMYFTLKDNSPAAAISWALGVTESLLQDGNLEAAGYWLELARNGSKQLEKADLKAYFESYKELLESLKKEMKDDQLKILGEIEHNVFTVMYSPDHEN